MRLRRLAAVIIAVAFIVTLWGVAVPVAQAQNVCCPVREKPAPPPKPVCCPAPHPAPVCCPAPIREKPAPPPAPVCCPAPHPAPVCCPAPHPAPVCCPVV